MFFRREKIKEKNTFKSAKKLLKLRKNLHLIFFVIYEKWKKNPKYIEKIQRKIKKYPNMKQHWKKREKNA